MNLFYKMFLFTSSYSPLFLIFVLKLWGDEIIRFNFLNIPNILFLSLISIVFFLIFITLIYFIIVKPSQKGRPSDIKIINSVSNLNSNVMTNYLVTLLIPISTIGLTSQIDIFIALLIVAVLFVIFIEGNLVYINPLLQLMGFNVYELDIRDHNATKDSSKRIILISKAVITQFPDESEIKLKLLNGLVYFDMRKL